MLLDQFDDIFTAEHQELRQSCRRFCQEYLKPSVLEWEEAEEFPRELYQQAANVGLLGVEFSTEYGGGGGDALHAAVVTEELLRAGSTGVVVGLGSLSIALPPILSLGTDQQKHQYLPPVLAGKSIACLAITEPDTGSDVAGIRTKAERKGSGYILNGSKTFITSGVRADLMVVLARTGEDSHGGLSFFVVEADQPGVTVAKSLKKTGWRASDTAEIFFSQVELREDQRLGPEGSGFAALMHNFNNERLMLAVQGYATAEICWQEARQYCKERKAFGKPLVGFQVSRHKLAQMLTQVAAAKSLTLRTLAAHCRGQASPAAAAMAKNFSAQVAQQVCYEAVQLHGGMGYMRESLVERLSRDARLLPIGGGTQEVMDELIAKFI